MAFIYFICRICRIFAQQLNEYVMIKQADILLYASEHSSFTCQQLVEHFQKLGNVSSLNSVSTRLKRMADGGILTKKERGVFGIDIDRHTPFTAYFDDEMHSIESFIKEKFPFVKFTIWNIWDLKSLAHHVANSDIIYIDVEKEVVESVFNGLMAYKTDRQLFYKPTDLDYERYINKSSIVVRSLISESPLVSLNNELYRVTLEKILVDAAIDKDFISFQGYEIVRVYRTAFDRYQINKSKLFRYARRRSQESEIKSIIKDINLEGL